MAMNIDCLLAISILNVSTCVIRILKSVSSLGHINGISEIVHVLLIVSLMIYLKVNLKSNKFKNLHWALHMGFHQNINMQR